MVELPVEPKGKLAQVFEQISPSAGEVLRQHLLGGTPAEWISMVLREQIPDAPSATTIKTYRRSLPSDRSV